MSAASGKHLFRLVVIGCGSIGKRHIKNLLTLRAGRVLAFDARADRRKEVENELDVEVLDSLEDAWTYDPDVAVIAVPTCLHVPLALESAKHGCHLFIEKPLSDRLEGIDELLEAVRGGGLISLVGCNLRFHPALIKIKQLLAEGAVGQVISARVEVGQYLPDWHPWEDYRQGYSARSDLGGGVILDAIHEIDYIRWMLGDIESVACFTGKLSRLEIETEDIAAMIFRFCSGAIGEVHMDYIQRAYSRACHIIGEEGTIRWDYTAGEVRWYSAMTRDWYVFSDPSGWESNQMYLDEMRHFLGCLIGAERPAVDVFEAKRVLEVALLAKASAAAERVLKLNG